jgi:hypothetical protein
LRRSAPREAHLKYTHVHDNDGEHHTHRLPGQGTIDWEALGEGLRCIDYGGIFLLEVFDAAVDLRRLMDEDGSSECCESGPPAAEGKPRLCCNAAAAAFEEESIMKKWIWTLLLGLPLLITPVATTGCDIDELEDIFEDIDIDIDVDSDDDDFDDDDFDDDDFDCDYDDCDDLDDFDDCDYYDDCDFECDYDDCDYDDCDDCDFDDDLFDGDILDEFEDFFEDLEDLFD